MSNTNKLWSWPGLAGRIAGGAISSAFGAVLKETLVPLRTSNALDSILANMSHLIPKDVDEDQRLMNILDSLNKLLIDIKYNAPFQLESHGFFVTLGISIVVGALSSLLGYALSFWWDDAAHSKESFGSGILFMVVINGILVTVLLLLALPLSYVTFPSFYAYAFLIFLSSFISAALKGLLDDLHVTYRTPPPSTGLAPSGVPLSPSPDTGRAELGR